VSVVIPCKSPLAVQRNPPSLVLLRRPPLPHHVNVAVVPWAGGCHYQVSTVIPNTIPSCFVALVLFRKSARTRHFSAMRLTPPLTLLSCSLSNQLVAREHLAAT